MADDKLCKEERTGKSDLVTELLAKIESIKMEFWDGIKNKPLFNWTVAVMDIVQLNEDLFAAIPKDTFRTDMFLRITHPCLTPPRREDGSEVVDPLPIRNLISMLKGDRCQEMTDFSSLCLNIINIGEELQDICKKAKAMGFEPPRHYNNLIKKRAVPAAEPADRKGAVVQNAKVGAKEQKKAEDRFCFGCGRAGHLKSQCFRKNHPNWNGLNIAWHLSPQGEAFKLLGHDDLPERQQFKDKNMDSLVEFIPPEDWKRTKKPAGGFDDSLPMVLSSDRQRGIKVKVLLDTGARDDDYVH